MASLPLKAPTVACVFRKFFDMELWQRSDVQSFRVIASFLT